MRRKRAIREARLSTKSRRTGQVVRTFECKIKVSRLNSRQKEELERLFVEAKWFYNHVLSLKKEQECKLCEISTTDIKSVTHLDKNGNEVETELRVLSSQ